MDLGLDLVDILTDEQKTNLQDLYYKKICDAIAAADFSQAVRQPVERWFDDMYLEEYIDMDEIAKQVSVQVSEALKRSFGVPT